MAQKVKKVLKYYKIYKAYLKENDLDDDSDQITVPSLMLFVKEHISDDDFKRLDEEL